MHRTRLVGTVLTLAGLVGYALGIATAYPGRAFSVTAVMVGIAFYAVGGTTAEVET